MSPSGSVATAVQVNTSPARIPVSGVMSTLRTVGFEFTTPTDALAVAVPPSRAAAKAATEGLKRELLGSHYSAGGAPIAPTSIVALQSIVSDRSGVLAMAAAEALCWETTELPDELCSQLRDHTRLHIGAFE